MNRQKKAQDINAPMSEKRNDEDDKPEEEDKKMINTLMSEKSERDEE